MAENQNASENPSSTRAGGGPEADNPVYKELEAERRDPHAQGSYQATAETEYPHRAVVDRTGTAMRAAAAAGGSPGPNALEDAERAFTESRGNHEPREKPTGRS